MALSDVTVTFNLTQLLGEAFDARRTRAYVKTNVANGTLMDTSTGEIRLGDQKVAIGDDGTGSFTTWAPGADGNPTSWQTSLVVEYPRTGQRDRTVRTFGPYTITASADLADLEEEQAVPAEYLTQVTDELQTYSDAAASSASAAQTARTGAEAARDEAQALVLSDLGTTDGQTRALIENPASQTASALSASIEAGVEPRALAAEFWCDFTTKPTGDRPEVDDAGHALQYDKNSNTLSAFDIIEADNFAGTSTPIRGLSSAATTGVAASYVVFKEIENTGTRRRFSGEFVLRSPGGYGGVCIGWWQERPGDNGTFPTIVPNSPCHLELYNDRWVLSKFTGGSSGVTATPTSLIASTLWGTPLSYLTRYRVDIVVEDGRLTVDLPDGSQQVVTDSSILAANAVHPFLEIQASDQATQGKATWLWADGDSTIDRRNYFVRQLLGLGRKIVGLDPSNTESSAGRVLSGLRNAASASGALIPGGFDNIANTVLGHASGQYARTRARGHWVRAVGRFAATGDAQFGFHQLYGTTSTNAATKLGTDGTANLSGGIPLQAVNMQACSALVVAERTDGSSGEMAAYRVDFAVKRYGATRTLGTPVVTALYEDDATWNATAVLDSTNSVWHIEATGATGKTIRWNAAVYCVEVA